MPVESSVAGMFSSRPAKSLSTIQSKGSLMGRRSVLAMFAVMAIVLGGVVVSTPAGAVVDTAVVVPSPNAGTNDELRSVSCVSVYECFAVGDTTTGNNVYETLVVSLTGPVPPSTTTTLSSPDQVVPAFTG